MLTLTTFNTSLLFYAVKVPYICGTFIFISLGLVRLVSLMRKG